MKKKIILAALGLAMLTGCSSDDDSNDTTIQGKWHLMTIIGSEGETQLELERGNSIWTFNDDTGILVIENEGPVNQMVPWGDASGNYLFSIVELEDGNHLFKEEDDYGLMTISGNAMKLEFGEDGSYNFKR